MKEKASLYLQVSEMTFLFPEEEMGKLSYLAYEWSYKRPRFDPSVYPNVYLHMQLPLTKKGKQRHTFHSKRSGTKTRSLLFIEVRSYKIGSRQHHSLLFSVAKIGWPHQRNRINPFIWLHHFIVYWHLPDSFLFFCLGLLLIKNDGLRNNWVSSSIPLENVSSTSSWNIFLLSVSTFASSYTGLNGPS